MSIVQWYIGHLVCGCSNPGSSPSILINSVRVLEVQYKNILGPFLPRGTKE